MATKDEALKMAIEWLDDYTPDEVINACKEALEQPAEPRLVSYAPDGSTCTLNIDGEEVYFNREQPAQEPVAWMKGALDNARDVCKYLDHDMVKEAKAHTQFFWNDLDKIREFDNTHPHQWQGLTDDEIWDIANFLGKKEWDYPVMFAKTIEKVLREKNDY